MQSACQEAPPGHRLPSRESEGPVTSEVDTGGSRGDTGSGRSGVRSTTKTRHAGSEHLPVPPGDSCATVKASLVHAARGSHVSHGYFTSRERAPNTALMDTWEREASPADVHACP